MFMPPPNYKRSRKYKRLTKVAHMRSILSDTVPNKLTRLRERLRSHINYYSANYSWWQCARTM